MASRQVLPEIVRSVAFGSITTSYADLGSALSNPLVMLTLKNTSDKTLFVTENGSDDHYELPAGATESLDFQANATGNLQLRKAAGIQFQVKGVLGDLPTSGKIILQGQYV